MDHMRFKGVIPPIVTPLTEGGDVDVPSLERLVEHLVRAGVSGVFALGTSGEVTGLSDAQREKVLQAVTSAVDGRVHVFAGVIETSTNRVLSQIDRFERYAPTAIVATMPFYAAVHPDEVETHFRRVADATDLPLLAYDIPSRVGGQLRDHTILALASDRVITGIKDSSGAPARIRRLVASRTELALNDFSIFTGSETTVDTDILQGADGVVPGLGNVDPASYVAIYEAAAKGDLSSAQQTQTAMINLFRIIDVPDLQRLGMSAAALGAFKAALNLLGVIDCPMTCSPGGNLNEKEFDGIRSILSKQGLL